MVGKRLAQRKNRSLELLVRIHRIPPLTPGAEDNDKQGGQRKRDLSFTPNRPTPCVSRSKQTRHE
eukprot:15463592-Alexandrium_andersonii.AAC.1